MKRTLQPEHEAATVHSAGRRGFVRLLSRASPYLICALVCSASSLRAIAASYYVDFAGGSDAAAGTSTGAAFKHCPGDGNATSTAAGKTLAAGDIVYFKGGVTYVVGSGGIEAPWSGTTGSVITYDGNSGGGWGTGKAIITANYSNAVGFSLQTVLNSNILVRNFSFTGFGGSATLPPDLGSAVPENFGAGIYTSLGLKDSTIRDCDFAKCGYYFNEKPMNAASINGGGIYIQPTVLNVVISNCTFKEMSSGISSTFASRTNLQVLNCYFGDKINWMMDLAYQTGGSADSNKISGCLFDDHHWFDDGQWTGYGGFPHSDSVFLRTTTFSANLGTRADEISGNTFFCTNGLAGGTAAIYISGGPTALVFNNVFYNANKANGVVCVNDKLAGQTVTVAYNTFYAGYQLGLYLRTDSTTYLTNCTALNNLFVTTGVDPNATDYYITTLAAGIHINYNFHNTANNQFLLMGSPSLGDRTLQGMRSVYSWENNGTTNNISFVDAATMDLHLASISPASGIGTNLAWLTTVDKDGRSRPSTPAVGAYEYYVAPPTSSGTLFVTNLIHQP